MATWQPAKPVPGAHTCTSVAVTPGFHDASYLQTRFYHLALVVATTQQSGKLFLGTHIVLQPASHLLRSIKLRVYNLHSRPFQRVPAPADRAKSCQRKREFGSGTRVFQVITVHLVGGSLEQETANPIVCHTLRTCECHTRLMFRVQQQHSIGPVLGGTVHKEGEQRHSLAGRSSPWTSR